MASTKPTFRVYCRADPCCNLAVSGGTAILAPIDEFDDRQHWYKEEKYNNKKDIWGFPGFSLVNKETGQALKHTFTHPVPVKLVSYNPDVLDESVLWAHADDRGEGYRAIRSLNYDPLHMEAAALNDCSYDGAIVVGGQWIDGNNQQWKIEPHS